MEGDQLLEQGYQQSQVNRLQEAIQSFQQALEQYRAAGYRPGESRTLLELGNILSYQGDHQQALQYYEQSLVLAQELQNHTGEFNIYILLQMSKSASASGKPEQAFELIQRAETILQADFPPGALRQFQEVSILVVRSNVYSQQGNHLEAIEILCQALAILRNSDLREELSKNDPNAEAAIRYSEAAILECLATSYEAIGQNPEALGALQTATTIVQALGQDLESVRLLRRISTHYSNLGQLQKAAEPLRTALDIVHREGDQEGEASVLQLLGDNALRSGLFPTAVDYLQQAATLSRRTNNFAVLGITLVSLTNAHTQSGQYQQAIVAAQEVVAIGQRIADTVMELTGLTILVSIYSDRLGQHSQAGDLAQQALEIAQRASNQSEQVSALNILGGIYFKLERYEEAVQRYQQALVIANTNNLVSQKIRILFSLNQLYLARKEGEPSISCLQEALKIMRETHNTGQEAVTLMQLGITYLNLEQYPQALELLNQALAMTRQSGDRLVEQKITYELARGYLAVNQYLQSIECADQTYAIAQERNDQMGQAVALYTKAAATGRSGRLAEAESLQVSGLNIIESIWETVLNDESKVALLDYHSFFYKALQSTLVAQNKIEKALETSEQARVRVLAERLSDHIAASDAIAHLSGSTELNSLSIDTIKQIAQQQNATLVEYALAGTEEEPFLYIYVVQPNGEIRFQSVSLSQRALAELVTNSRAVIGARGRKAEPVTGSVESSKAAYPTQQAKQRQALQKLHQLLIEPISSYLPALEGDRIIFIPQSELFLVPFPALMDANGKYLIERYTVLTALSIQLLGLTHTLRQRSQTGQFLLRSVDPANILIVGNPTMPSLPALPFQPPQQLSALPGTQAEANQIAQELQTQPLIGDEATETVVRERMLNAQVIHLATHGLLEYGIPSESFVRDLPGAIALAPSGDNDGLLTSAEIYQMKLKAELVVLSACDTGRGTLTSDGVIGLSHPLIMAGVPTVIVSLWKVPDEPTAKLMIQFYRNLRTQCDKAQALRQAMLTTMQTHPKPINWAAFTLIGAAE